MYGDPARADEHVYAFLKQAFSRLSGYQAKPFEILDDHRSGEPNVAVIVSLYKAADKLNFFLTALSQQTLVRQDKVELILIDSGSPTNERTVLDAYFKSTPLNFVYARSRERETIQAAWNRGITLARAPYLVFLGVDETLYPEALEILAQELHKDSDVDWVMGNSLVTSVDHAGLYQCDIMPYDRTGAGKDHVYLETCYLSWVGGMYRKSLHDRFGYYDETFGAAGDTEFKSRILPYIKVKFIDRILGLFLNYPDGQTTMSPRAEIEDLRAWYIHRTPGGVRYAFENRPIEEAEALLRTSISRLSPTYKQCRGSTPSREHDARNASGCGFAQPISLEAKMWRKYEANPVACSFCVCCARSPFVSTASSYPPSAESAGIASGNAVHDSRYRCS